MTDQTKISFRSIIIVSYNVNKEQKIVGTIDYKSILELNIFYYALIITSLLISTFKRNLSGLIVYLF